MVEKRSGTCKHFSALDYSLGYKNRSLGSLFSNLASKTLNSLPFFNHKNLGKIKLHLRHFSWSSQNNYSNKILMWNIKNWSEIYFCPKTLISSKVSISRSHENFGTNTRCSIFFGPHIWVPRVNHVDFLNSFEKVRQKINFSMISLTYSGGNSCCNKALFMK